MSETRAILCPYCGDRQLPAQQCRACAGRFDVWSLQATQNEMGAWYVRDPRRPHFVGFGYEALCAAIRNGEIGREAIVRGPSTRQFWTIARRVPGLAHLFGRCYACQAPIASDDPACRACGAATSIDGDRNFFGLPAYEPIAPPADAKPDHSAFILDSGLLVIRAIPVRSPARTIVRVAQPAMLPAEQFVATDAGEIASPPVPEAREAPAPEPRSASSQAPRSALSAIDRGLLERSRRLETWNRVLFGMTAAGFAFALLFGLAYFLEVNERRNEVEAARRKGAEDVRSEFERSAPVVVPPPAELPAMPSDPAAGGSGAKSSVRSDSVGPSVAGSGTAVSGEVAGTSSSDAAAETQGRVVPNRGGRLRDQAPPEFSPPTP